MGETKKRITQCDGCPFNEGSWCFQYKRIIPFYDKERYPRYFTIKPNFCRVIEVIILEE